MTFERWLELGAEEERLGTQCIWCGAEAFETEDDHEPCLLEEAQAALSHEEQLNEEAADEEWHGDDTWAEHDGDR